MLDSIFKRLKEWFVIKSKQPKIRLSNLRPGNLVEIEFHDPRKMGLLDPGGQLTKRYDPDDLNTLSLIGTVTNRFQKNGLWFIELTVTKVFQGTHRTRLYTLMEDDVRNIRIIK
jgi:hypothetical protein